MRILLVTPVPPDPRAPGAIPALLHAAVRGLRTRHDVTLVTAVHAGDAGAASVLQHLARAGVDVEAVVVPRRGRLGRMRQRTHLAARWAAGDAPRQSIWHAGLGLDAALRRACARTRFDLVQIEDASLAGLSFPDGVPVVYTEHEVRRPRAWRVPVPGRRWSWRAWAEEIDWQRWHRHQAAAWRRADRVQVFSARDAEVISAYAPDVVARVRVNPFALDLPPAPMPDAEEPDTLLFAGHFLHAPNVEAACWLVEDILPRVQRRRPGAWLLLVGPDPHARVRSLGLRPGVTVTGAVPDVVPLLRAATVVAAPVRAGGGQRMKVLHGMAAGKAVVTTPRGAEGLPAAAETGALVVAEQAEQIADATVHLLESRRLRRRTGERARAYVEAHHTPEAYARRAEAVYAEVVR